MALTSNDINNLVSAMKIYITEVDTENNTMTHTFPVDGYEITQVWRETEPEDKCFTAGDVSHQECNSGVDDEPMLRVVKMLRSGEPLDNPILTPMRELRALAALSRPEAEDFCVQMVGWFKNPSQLYIGSELYITMEDLPLGDLGSLLCDVGRLPEEDARQIALQIFLAITYIHSQNFVHGSVQLEKVLIVSSPPSPWKVKLCGFSHATFFEYANREEPTTPTTDGYRAPEDCPEDCLPGCQRPCQVQEHSLDQIYRYFIEAQAADVWAAGETVYLLIVGVKRSSRQHNHQHVRDYLHRRRRRSLHLDLIALAVSDRGRRFIEHATRSNMYDRPSALEATVHSWLSQMADPIAPNRRNFKITRRYQLRENGEDPPLLRFSPGARSLIVIIAGDLYVATGPAARGVTERPATRVANGTPFKDADFRGENELLALTVNGQILAMDKYLLRDKVLVQATNQEEYIAVAVGRHRFARSCANRIDVFSSAGEKIRSVDNLPQPFIGMAFDIDGFTLMAAFSKELLLVNGRDDNGRDHISFLFHAGEGREGTEITKVAFCPTLGSVAYCNGNGTVSCFNTRSREGFIVGRPLASSPCLCLSLDHWGQMLGVTRQDGTTMLYEIQDPASPPMALITDIPPTTSLALSPGGRKVAIVFVTQYSTDVRYLEPKLR